MHRVGFHLVVGCLVSESSRPTEHIVGGAGNPSASIIGDINAAFEPKGLLLMSVPAVLYLVQNNLLFFAMANVDAGLYQGSFYCWGEGAYY